MLKVFSLAAALTLAAVSGAMAQVSERPEAQVVLKWYELLNADKADEAFELVGEDFVQHNPSAAPDRASNLAMFKQMSGYFRYDVKRVVSEGEFVVVHGQIGSGPQAYAAADFFRVVDGKIVEHWDDLQQIPESPINPTPMF